ncbi:MAG: hypothetical protein AB9866_13765 [Syntrophobacteraceae bacterium]
MSCKILGKVLKLSSMALCLSMFAGCSTFEFGSKPDFGYTWVSPEGKSQEQLLADQTDCRRDMATTGSPASAGSAGVGSGSWDMGDYKNFDRCMRAKGWVKE